MSINWRTNLGVAPATIIELIHIIIRELHLQFPQVGHLIASKKGQNSKNSLSCPPSLSTAWRKQRWRSGVHRSLGILDRTYRLTDPEPAFRSLSSTVLLLELPPFFVFLSSSTSSSSPSSPSWLEKLVVLEPSVLLSPAPFISFIFSRTILWVAKKNIQLGIRV